MTMKSSAFCNELFEAIVNKETKDNILISPTSIHTCLALSYLGAEGVTADELKTGLQLVGGDREEVAKNCGKVLEKLNSNNNKLKLANRVYTDEKFDISQGFNELASKYFNATAEKVKFADTHKAAAVINAWVEQQTEGKIKDVVLGDSLSANTSIVLINALYFNANWENKFDDYDTEKKDFHINENETVQVDMMWHRKHYQYGDLEELDATALEMPYENSDMSMLILLPKQMQGLAELETKLSTKNIIDISAGLSREFVRVSLPKFKYEYDISLQSALEELGMKAMFTSEANFNQLLSESTPINISKVIHKACIEVNENDTIAAAACIGEMEFRSGVRAKIIYDFVVDHPFLFAIKDKELVYFIGHVKSF